MNEMTNESLRFFRLEKPALLVGLVGLASTAFWANSTDRRRFGSIGSTKWAHLDHKANAHQRCASA